jgi:hypothetical protein
MLGAAASFWPRASVAAEFELDRRKWRYVMVGGVLWGVFALRIDHLAVSRGWGVADSRTFAVPGSDHRGLRSVEGPVGGPTALLCSGDSA